MAPVGATHALLRQHTACCTARRAPSLRLTSPGCAWPNMGLLQVTTMDVLPTLLELLGNVSRPAEQAHWPLDGTSILPILRGE